MWDIKRTNRLQYCSKIHWVVELRNVIFLSMRYKLYVTLNYLSRYIKKELNVYRERINAGYTCLPKSMCHPLLRINSEINDVRINQIILGRKSNGSFSNSHSKIYIPWIEKNWFKNVWHWIYTEIDYWFFYILGGEGDLL